MVVVEERGRQMAVTWGQIVVTRIMYLDRFRHTNIYKL